MRYNSYNEYRCVCAQTSKVRLLIRPGYLEIQRYGTRAIEAT